MKVILAADHAGFHHKALLHEALENEGFEVIDVGAHEFNEGDDYPVFVKAAVDELHKDPHARAVILGGSGQGEAIAANRFTGIRAVVFNGLRGNRPDGGEIPNELLLSREHNDSNMLSLGARFLAPQEMVVAVLFWLSVPFPGHERHERRNAMLDALA
jgi:ribose 5-phosphate isomerase B